MAWLSSQLTWGVFLKCFLPSSFALPRDIDAAVAKLDNVFLYNLDDLAKIADANLAARTAEVGHARKIVSEKAAALWKQIEPQAGGSL